MSDDKHLAFVAYSLAGIPWREWDEHYAVDTIGTHGILTKAARTAYRAIAASYRPV